MAISKLNITFIQLFIIFCFQFDTDILFGSALSLSNLVDIFNRVSQESDLVYLKECANLLSRVANLPVRNVNIQFYNILSLFYI